MELNENLSLGDMAGMGEVSLPSETSVGSGDIPAGKGDAEEEYKKKRNKKKQREMKNIISFESFGSVTEAKAYKLKASEFGADTHSAPYNVKGEPTWRVHSTYAIDQVSGENNPEERDVVFFEAMPINNDIYIKIGGINNLKRSNGATVGNNFSTTIEEWKNDPEGIAKEASEFLTDAIHLKWINKKARSEGQTIKWALKDDYSSVIIDLVNKSLGLSESAVTEGMSKSAIKKAIKVIDKQIDTETGGDGEPLDNETLQALEQERERLLGLNEGKFDGIADLVKSLHFEMDPKTAEEKKIELGYRQGEVTKRKQIEGGNYSLRRFRKEIKYWDGNKRDQEWAEGVFAGPDHYNTVKSTLGAGIHSKPAKKVRWNQRKYDQWLEDVASNDGWKNAFDMAQNAQFEPGLIDWVEKNFRGDDPMQRIQWDIEAFAESTSNTLVNLKHINETKVVDKETEDEIFDSETYYTISKVLAIARKSKECKEQYKRESNFGNGLQLAERLKKEFPKIQFKCRVYRSEWNYGGNLCLSIELRGKSWKHEVFKFQSNNSTRRPNYSFAKLFNGTKKISTGKVEDEWGMGIVHGSYQSISSFDKFMDDVVGVFKDYKRVNGVEFDMKTVLAGFKAGDKILAEWTKLKPRIEKQYDIAKASGRKAHRRIEIRMPYIRTAEKKVYYKTDEPRELRHPDEYGQSAYDIIDGRDYAKYEAAQAKVSDMIEKFCKKHNFEFVWAASW